MEHQQDHALVSQPTQKISREECDPSLHPMVHSNGDEISGEVKSECEQPSVMQSGFASWKDLLIQRDLNIIYNCLRMVSDEGRTPHQRGSMVQTMLSAMKEMKEILLESGKPEYRSIRQGVFVNCPSPSAGIIPTLQKSGVLSLPHGKRMCLVCDKTIAHSKEKCDDCENFCAQICKAIAIGKPHPTCSHKHYSGGSGCSNCRYKKYKYFTVEGDSPVNTPVQKKRPVVQVQTRSYNGKKCPVCSQTFQIDPAKVSPWVCLICEDYEWSIARSYREGKPMPVCEHKRPEKPCVCPNCHQYDFLKEKRIRKQASS